MSRLDPEAEPEPDETRGSAPTELGRGRSGVVLRFQSPDGTTLARKVFGSGGLTKAVQVLLMGTPNPYAWNEAAIRCALLRRKIAVRLVPLWFGERMRVADAYSYGWEEDNEAWYLDTRLVDGTHALLVNPVTDEGRDHALILYRELMPQLQEHLIESGLDGLVWQAGKGNPVAIGNFMRDIETGVWWWIDLESGVPALVPLGPRPLFSFYLPRSFHHRGPLFDDIDVERLREYVAAQREALVELHGVEEVEALEADVAGLTEAQHEWKSPSRVDRGVAYALKTGAITEAQAAKYRRSHVFWYGRLARKAVGGVGRALGRLGPRVVRKVLSIPVVSYLRHLIAVIISHRARMDLADRWVRRRVQSWRGRRQLDNDEHAALSKAMLEEVGSDYLADFGVHLAIKPFVKTVEYWLFPVLFAAGLISGATLAAGVLGGGPAARSLYTLGRMVQARTKGQRLPWLALFVGIFPIVGNFAYPLQIVRSGGQDALVARFIVLDGASLAARAIPIWGGSDTWTEHQLNHLAYRLVRRVGG